MKFINKSPLQVYDLLQIIFTKKQVNFKEKGTDVYQYLTKLKLYKIDKLINEKLNDNYLSEFPYPTIKIDTSKTNIPMEMVAMVFFETPFHSLMITPQRLAIKMIKAICRIQELAPFPILLSPIP